jgi:hypothetical protein
MWQTFESVLCCAVRMATRAAAAAVNYDLGVCTRFLGTCMCVSR